MGVREDGEVSETSRSNVTTNASYIFVWPSVSDYWVFCWEILSFSCVEFLPPFMLYSCRNPSEYISAILELSALVTKRYHQLLLHIDSLYQLTCSGRRFHKACHLVHSFTDAVIQDRRRTLPSKHEDDVLKAKAKSKTLDFIDVLLLSKVGFSRSRMDIDAKYCVK